MNPRTRVSMLDLTTLTGEETDEEIAALCAKAMTPLGPVAAVCVYGRYVPRAVAELDGTPGARRRRGELPGGRPGPRAGAPRGGRRRGEDGAAEVDLVLPWRAWLDGNRPTRWPSWRRRGRRRRAP